MVRPLQRREKCLDYAKQHYSSLGLARKGRLPKPLGYVSGGPAQLASSLASGINPDEVSPELLCNDPSSSTAHEGSLYNRESAGQPRTSVDMLDLRREFERGICIGPEKLQIEPDTKFFDPLCIRAQIRKSSSHFPRNSEP